MKIFTTTQSHNIETQSPTASETWNTWESCKFATIASGESLLHRINFIMQKLDGEEWLPKGLKWQVQDGCDRIIESYRSGDLNPANAQRLVEELASTSYSYEDLTLQSSTLCQIRTLDLEMNDHLSQYDTHPRAV
ncbi:hypothetical protein [Pelagicoccus sp. SDUM812002]|uniref:hypothetical protein n=1 Tax=Pelagicoccus sp. SDUM812002 TaxID=3041266 RepID=UPI00280FBFB1|nr:hypothetical protein [Pelagicoccus sp. SDUM812002]MDQ8187401.1 hypothetical protein [Pelagicoccus sp. SDUM812002]